MADEWRETEKTGDERQETENISPHIEANSVSLLLISAFSVSFFISAIIGLTVFNLFQASPEPPKPRQEDSKSRSALLAQIQRGTRLRKVVQASDRSAPQIESKSSDLGLFKAVGTTMF